MTADKTERRSIGETIAGYAGPVVGAAYGAAVAWLEPGREKPQWLVWSSLAVAVTAAAGALVVYGVHRWTDLRAIYAVRKRDVAGPVAVLAEGSPEAAAHAPLAAACHTRPTGPVTKIDDDSASEARRARHRGMRVWFWGRVGRSLWPRGGLRPGRRGGSGHTRLYLPHEDGDLCSRRHLRRS
jgi:hypothetical protein